MRVSVTLHLGIKVSIFDIYLFPTGTVYKHLQTDYGIHDVKFRPCLLPPSSSLASHYENNLPTIVKNKINIALFTSISLFSHQYNN